MLPLPLLLHPATSATVAAATIPAMIKDFFIEFLQLTLHFG
jgi:hypothetical protein